MDVRRLRYLGAALAIVVAVIHLFHTQYGFPRLIEYLQVGTLFDPRPLVFTLSGFAIVAGVLLVFNGVARRPVYLLGIGLMLTYLGGYAAWHTVLDHGAFWPHIPHHSHHDVGFVETIAVHLANDLVVLLSKLVELALLVVLVVLYREDTG